MTSLLVAMAVGQTNLFRIHEVPVPGEQLIVMQAWVKGGDFPADEAAAWKILPDVMIAGTTTYTAPEVRRLATSAGFPVSVVSYPDMLRIQVVATPGDWQNAVRVFASLYFEPNLRQVDVDAAVKDAMLRRTSPYEFAADPRELNYGSVNEQLVRYVWQKHAQPAGTEFVVYGAVEPGLVAMLHQELRQWRQPAKATVRRGVSPAVVAKAIPGGVSVYRVACKPLTPSMQFSSAKLLATFALGAGKDCTLWRVHREKQGLTYLTEGILYPTLTGWRPTFTMLRTAGPEENKQLFTMVADMLADIETWDEQTLIRAKALAVASLTTGHPASPFWLTPSGPMAVGTLQQASWRGYLNLSGATAIGPAKWAEMLDVVDVETLKAQAKAMLTDSEIQLISGSP